FRHEMNALDSEANGRAVDSLLNYETVKYFNNEELEIKAYDKTLSKWADAGVQSHTSMSMLNFGQGAIVAVGVTAIMFMASTQVGKGELTLGDLVLINSMMLQLFMPLNILGIVYRQLQYSMADMGHVVELLERQPEVKDRPGATALQVRDARVVFDKVSFSYQAERLILEDVSITVEPGQKLAVVGPSGAGKSTLMRLLFRFYDVDSGCICIDDQDIREVTPRSLRKNLGVVPQDTVLFNNTIAYNIAYAKPDATEEEIRAAARQADLEDFIAQLPDGYETVVGERGLKLSGGEKQRLAIARVFLKNPPITILDEATSSLDSHSEKAILGALEKVSSRKTSLVIAHRLSTIVDADQIVVLDQGRVIEQGTHDSLLQENGMYASLWYMQLQDAEEEEPGEG
ncbi:MAG: ABCB family ABC transporter ATP-binding protein/permease, partial [bacterium]